MKIVVYAHRLEVGGTQVNAIELAAALRDAHGFDMLFFAQPGPLLSLVQEKQLRFVPAPDARYHPAIGRMRALRSLVREEKPDLIHAWDWWQGLDAFFSVHLPLRTPLIISDMMMDYERVLPKSVPTTFGIPSIAEHAKRQGYRHVLPLVPPVDTVANAPGAVDPDGFRAEWGIGENEIALVIVSRLSEWMKSDGILRSIAAMRALGAEHPARLVIVGDGSIRAQLQERASEVNAALGREAVTLTGALIDPRPAYAAADVVIGMGGSILRGMAFGKPTIVVGKKGNASAIFSPETREYFFTHGFGNGVAQAGEADPLADQIRTLVADQAKRRELGMFCRRFVVEDHSLQGNAALLAAFYKRAIAEKAAAGSVMADAVRTSAIYLRERRFRRASREATLPSQPTAMTA